MRERNEERKGRKEVLLDGKCRQGMFTLGGSGLRVSLKTHLWVTAQARMMV